MQQVASTGDLYINGAWVCNVTDFKFSPSIEYRDKDVNRAYRRYYRCRMRCTSYNGIANSKHKPRQVRMRGK